MSRRAQDRIRMYFYKTKDELKTNEIPLPQKQLQALILDLHNTLKMNKFHGYYFDRACAGNENMKSICDDRGTFICQGRWDKVNCLYQPAHSINPYVSREARIIFQTWNLDHNKERSRSIIPAILTALRVCGSINYNSMCSVDRCDRNFHNGDICRSLNGQQNIIHSENVLIGQNVILSSNKKKGKIVYNNVFDCFNVKRTTNPDQNSNGSEKVNSLITSFENVQLDVKGIYDDLFTTSNLRLVHIICHDKGAHKSMKAGPYVFLN